MRFMTHEAWDEFGFSLAAAINTLASHKPSPEVEATRVKLQEAFQGLAALGLFSESFSPDLASY